MVKGKGLPSLFFFPCAYPIFHHLLKRLFFPPWNDLGSSVDIINHRCENLFLGSQFYSTGLYVYSLCHCHAVLITGVSFEIGKSEPPTLLFKTGCLRSLKIPCEF